MSDLSNVWNNERRNNAIFASNCEQKRAAALDALRELGENGCAILWEEFWSMQSDPDKIMRLVGLLAEVGMDMTILSHVESEREENCP